MAKILVADDNSNIQKMVVLALKDQGIDVVAVGNGEAAVRKISDIHPDLVLADVFMPVRNGYEVCRYVKEDSKLSHIPVILLVGAFDPLDEQEAQRVAADGVLKKPFVPPDPLISMVKSALTRAGVSLGAAPAVEKPAPAESRPITELFHAATPKPAVPAISIPQAIPEPVEEFALPQPKVKISQGQEPVAFGSLLDTAEQDASAITSKPMINLTAGKWDEESDEVREEEDEEESSSNWRASSLDERVEKTAEPATGAAKDWRDEAFAESGATDEHVLSHWTPSLEAPEAPAIVEAAVVPSVAVSTIENAPASTTVPMASPFGEDDWASKMAAGVEEKLTEVKESAPAADTVHEEDTTVAEEAPAAGPANWAVVPESSWELEAKRASMLASTWDAPAAEEDTEATQDVPLHARHAPEFYQEHASQHDGEAASAYSGESAHAEEPTHAVEEHVEAAYAPAAAVVEEPKEEEPATESAAALVSSSVPVEEPPAEKTDVQEDQSEPATSSAAAAPQVAPDMDELVNRVLKKMSPEVISRVTQEILRPVIEALVRDELDSKK